MSEYVPIITTTLGARPEIVSKLIAGLTTGEYERVGGIIRRVDNKQVVTWLRTVSEGQSVNMTGLSGLGSLLHLNIATSLLDLSISAIGFTLVLKRLISIEGQLEKITDILGRMNRKLDQSFYGNFRAALDLAHSAFRMREETNKRISATQAINRFLEAEHCFLGMLDDELQVGSPAVSPFLSTLFLAYVSTAQCYLELGETETALRHFQEGDTVLSPRVKRYFSSVIEVNPAIFLHHGLAESISLERMTRLLRFRGESLTESMTFNMLRKEIWETASQKPEIWLRKFPASIWNVDIDEWKKQSRIPMKRSSHEMVELVLPRLKEAFAQVELAQESLGCINGYNSELLYLMENNIEYQAWRQIELPATGQDDTVALLMPKHSELLAV